MIKSNSENIWSRIAKSVAMLGCGTDAQRLAALGGVDRLLASHGLGFLEVAERLRCSTSTLGASPVADIPSGFGDLARAARDLDRGRLNPRERAFVNDMVAKGFAYRSSQRQAAWLGDILDRLRGRAAA